MKIQFFSPKFWISPAFQNTGNTNIVKLVQHWGLYKKSPFKPTNDITQSKHSKHGWTVTIPKVILGTENKGKISYVLRTWRAPAAGNNGTIINYHKFYIVPLYHSPFYHSDYFSRLMASLRTVSLDESSNVLSRVTILGTGFVIRRYLPQANLC